MSLGRRPTQYEGVLPKNPPNVIFANRVPVNGTDKAFVPGDIWVDQTDLSVFLFAGVAGAIWIALGTGATGGVVTINSLSPAAGNIIIAATANQVGVANAGHTVTLSIPSTFIAPGTIASTTTITSGTALIATTSLTAGTTITATLGAITATNGNLVLGTAGNKIIIPTGSNASVGTSSAMSGTPGEVTVATTACSATAKVFYSRATTGGTPGNVSITAQDGTGFTLTSTGNETSTFNWWIINA